MAFFKKIQFILLSLKRIIIIESIEYWIYIQPSLITTAGRLPVSKLITEKEATFTAGHPFPPWILRKQKPPQAHFFFNIPIL